MSSLGKLLKCALGVGRISVVMRGREVKLKRKRTSSDFSEHYLSLCPLEINKQPRS
jgi:hypothetical protein